jgi:thioredoxin 1
MPGRARGVLAMKFALTASLLALVTSLSAGAPLLLAQEGSKSKAKAEPPPVFKQASFKDALAETVGTDKILIVKGTAEWCGPCKQMDRTTWRDEKVVQWVKDNGLAIQVDVDKEEKVAANLKIRAMPTMIAFRNGKEVDRIVGGRSAKDLLAWTDDVKAGRTTAMKTQEKLEKAKAPGAAMSIDERLDLARELKDAEKFSEAVEQFVWLWQNMIEEEPSYASVRLSFMASDMQELAASNEPAKQAFTKLRDDTQARLESEDKAFEDLADWIVLNRVVDDQSRTLEWFDRIKDRPSAPQTIARVSHLIDELLKEENRWADWGKLLRAPAAQVRQHYAIVSMTASRKVATDDPGDLSFVKNYYREQSGEMYCALLAAGREVEAKEVASVVIELDDTAEARIALVQGAMMANQSRAEQVALLDDAEAKGGNVEKERQWLKAALAKSTEKK